LRHIINSHPPERKRPSTPYSQALSGDVRPTTYRLCFVRSLRDHLANLPPDQISLLEGYRECLGEPSDRSRHARDPPALARRPWGCRFDALGRVPFEGTSTESCRRGMPSEPKKPAVLAGAIRFGRRERCRIGVSRDPVGVYNGHLRTSSRRSARAKVVVLGIRMPCGSFCWSSRTAVGEPTISNFGRRRRPSSIAT
jgi:hypothetical protein